MKTKRHITMLDIAKAAGVSKSAVSKALNDKSDISREIKDRVFKICEEMGYQINFRIQDMVKERITGKTDNIAFVSVGIDFSDPAYSKMVDGIAVGVEERNLRLLLERLSGNEKSMYDFPAILRDGRVDGFLLSGILNQNVMIALRKLDIPFVVIGTYPENLMGGAVQIIVDSETGISGIVGELVERGQKRIAFFSETPSNFIQKHWLNQLKNAMTQHNIEFDDELYYKNKGPFTGAFEIMLPVFKQRELPFDSLVCLDYRTAQEISHLAYGHSREFATAPITIATSDAYKLHNPIIPTVYYVNQLAEIAQLGVATLVDLIHGKQPESKIVSTPSLNTKVISPSI